MTTYKIKKIYDEIFNPTEINFESFTKLPILLFRMILLDFQPISENATFKMKVKHYLRKCLSWFAIVSCTLSAYQIIFYAVSHSKNFDAVIGASRDALSMLLINFKGLIVFLRKDDIREILEEMKILFDDRSTKNADNGAKKFLKKYHQLMKIYAVTFILMNIFLTALWIPYFLNGSTIYLTHLWFPFEFFPVNHFWIEWDGYICSVLTMASDSLLYGLITVISMEFYFLNNDLIFIKVETKDKRREKIAVTVDRHNKLLEMCKKLQKIFEPYFLYGFITSSLILCMISFELVATSLGTMSYMFDVSYLAMNGSQILLLCFYGQKLIDSSAGLENAIYGCDWTDLDDNDFKKTVVIIMVRAQRPMKLTAMGFADISLETFAAVIYFIQL